MTQNCLSTEKKICVQKDYVFPEQPVYGETGRIPEEVLGKTFLKIVWSSHSVKSNCWEEMLQVEAVCVSAEQLLKPALVDWSHKQ